MVKNVLDLLDTLSPEQRKVLDAKSELETAVSEALHSAVIQLADVIMHEEKLQSTGNRMNVLRKTAHCLMIDVVHLITKHDDTMTRENAKQLLRLYRDDVVQWFDLIINGAYDQVRDMYEQLQADTVKKQDGLQ